MEREAYWGSRLVKRESRAREGGGERRGEILLDACE